MNRRSNRAILGCAAFAASSVSLIGLGTPARADLKVVEQITRPSREGSMTQTVTAYFQGDRVRLENDKGAVTLIDGAAGNAYNLDKANKQYNEHRLPPAHGAPPDGMPSSTLKLTAGSDTMTFAGLNATKYTVTGTAPMGPPRMRGGRGPSAEGGEEQGGPPQGGPGNGDQGGPPQGGPGEGGASQSVEKTREVKVDGEYWLSPDLSKPLTSTKALLPYLEVVAGPVGPMGAEALFAQISSGNLFPVSVNMTAVGPTPDGQTRTMKFSVKVVFVSTADLDKSLFTLPSDYEKVTTHIAGVSGRPERPSGNPPAERQQ